MKVLRVSLYKSPYVTGQNPNDPKAPVNQPMSIVMREVDLAVPVDEAYNEQRFTAAENSGFATGEIFDVPDGSTIQHVTILAERRRQRRAQREVNQSMLFYWVAMHLPRVSTGGVISGTRPTPLNVKAVEEVLELLAVHPDYDHQRVIVFADTGLRLQMQDGKIT